MKQVKDRKKDGDLIKRRLIRRVAKAIEFMHSLGFAHLDLKPENLIFFKDIDKFCKLTDFDTVTRFGAEVPKFYSFEFTSPEFYDMLFYKPPVMKTEQELKEDMKDALERKNYPEVQRIAVELENQKKSSEPAAAVAKPSLIARKDMDVWSLGVCILYILMEGKGFNELPLETDARIVKVADGTFIQGLVKELPSTSKLNDDAKRALFDNKSKNLLELNPETRMSLAEFMGRSLMSDSETKTSYVATMTKEVKKHVDKKAGDLADHVTATAIAASDRTVEKIGENIEDVKKHIDKTAGDLVTHVTATATTISDRTVKNVEKEIKEVKKHVNKKAGDLADHVTATAIAASDRTVEKIDMNSSK